MEAINVIGPTVDSRVGGTPGGASHTDATVSHNPSRTAGPVPAADAPALDPEQARKYVQHVQEVLQRVAPQPHRITFRHDDSTNNYVIEVRNPDGSLVRQYPPEKMLNLRRNLDELSGMVIDEMT